MHCLTKRLKYKKSVVLLVGTLSKELTLLQNIYSEIKELKKKIEDVDEKLLDIKAMLLKEEEESLQINFTIIIKHQTCTQ